MELLKGLIDVVLHLDRHLTELVAAYSIWTYAIVFLVVFCETGLVVTPFLPGDSLLFALGALAAVDQTGTLRPVLLWLLLMVAAIGGNELNFRIGRAIGPKAFNTHSRWLKREYLLKTHAFYEKHGGKTIILSRFLPILRTFAPFVAGIGTMNQAKFSLYNLVGGIAWASLFLWSGFLFGNVPVVKNNFGLVTIAIIVISLLPMGWAVISSRSTSSAAQ